MPTIQDIQKGLKDIETTALGIKEQSIYSDFTTEFQKKIMGNLDIVSSEKSPLETEIEKSIAETKEAKEVTETGIKAEFERGRTELKETGERKITTELEARRGFATNTALIRQLEESNEKSMKDWDLREKQALAFGRTEEADKIANLRLKSMEFAENKKQQAFTNLLQMGQFGMQVESMARQKEEFAYRKAVDTINLMKDFNIAGSFNADKMKLLENTLGLQPGAINKITPKVDEKLDFYAIDNAGNVTAVYRDTKTNKITIKTFAGIGGTKKTEEKKVLSQVVINNLGFAGVEENVANSIQEDLNAGFKPDAIIAQLEKNNPGKGKSIWDSFSSVVSKTQYGIPWGGQ